MCGIAGAFAFADGAPAPDPAIVARLNEAQRRRGPDGAGLWLSARKAAVLGHRRLSIIDVGATGAQPMQDASRRWTISFNGEIYNYAELRQELEGRGRRFTSGSDTEVLINAVAEWGEAGLTRLRGMFAFALWDEAEQELWLVRDPFGVKPLFWAESAGTIWFASQARPLAAHAPISPKRDAAGMVGFYLWGAVPEPFTWWEAIRLLPAGQVLRIGAGKSLPQPRSFCQIADGLLAPRKAPALTQTPTQDLRTALIDSVRHHLVADVPVGVFLSSGIDSTAIAELATAVSGKIQTVCLAFDAYLGTDRDEAPLAEETARLLGAEHRTVRLSRDQVMAAIEDFLVAMDQPTTDGLNSYLVSQATAGAGLKAALSGLGADELFGGYPSFAHIPKLLSLGKALPFRSAFGGWLEPFGRLMPGAGLRKYPSAVKYSGDLESAYFLRRCLHLHWELDALADPRLREEGLARLKDAQHSGVARTKDLERAAGLRTAISEMELCRYMRNQPLRDADWASMAHGLEVRVPFLDAPLLGCVAGAMASPRPFGKSDLAACAGPVTRRLAGRRKTGFTTPIGEWDKSRSGLKGWAKTVARRFDAAGAAP